MTTPTLEERKRRLRIYLLSSLVFLFFIWIFKFSHPQFSIIPSTSLGKPAGPITQAPKPTTTHKATTEGKWKPKPAISHDSDTGVPLADPKTPKVTLDDRAAVIIQSTFRQNLIPLILHFSAILGPSWPVLIYTSPESLPSFSASAALARHISLGLVQIRLLPQTVLFTTSESYSAFMTNPWIWESLDPVEWVLMFDSDSMLCGNAARSVEDYFEYTFVGAPIKQELGKGYNGGLSLRKRSAVLRVLDAFDWEKSRKEGDRFEDQWFYNRLKELQIKDKKESVAEAAGSDSNNPDEADDTINLPSIEVARTFAVETVDYPHPLGVHSIHRFEAAQLSKLDDWCPEYKLCSVEAKRG